MEPKKGVKIEPDISSQNLTRKSLRFSIYDGSFYSVMDALKGFTVPFALALKASTTMIGLMASLPDLFASFIQFFLVDFIERIKQRKKVIVICAFLQAITWIPLLFIPLIFPKYGLVLFLFFLTIFAVYSAIINPLWISLMGDIVPEDSRGSYFGKRNMITGIVAFITTFIGGYLLKVLTGISPYLGFGILFMLALVARLFSTFYLMRMHDSQVKRSEKAYFSFSDFVRKMNKTNYGRFVIYLCLIHLVVGIASPFFAVYMLRDLHFNYLTFTIITLGSVVSSFIGMYFWGKINDKFGSKRLLYINGFLIPFVPILWLFTTNAFILFWIEVFSGFVWAGFNLGSSNFIYDATTPEKRTRCVVYYNVLNSIAVFIGVLSGSYLVLHVSPWIFISAIPILFMVSGVLRLLTSVLFLKTIKELRLVEFPVGHSAFRTYLTIKPKQGIIYETIGSYKDDSAQEFKEKIEDDLDKTHSISEEEVKQKGVKLPPKIDKEKEKEDTFYKKRYIENALDEIKKK